MPGTGTPVHGRVDADGTVWVVRDGGEAKVGQYVAGTPEEGLAFYVRKYDELAAEAELTIARLGEGRGNAESAAALAARLREQAAEPHVVGDLTRLIALADGIDAASAAARERKTQAKAAAKAAVLAQREAIATEAESMAGSTQWKSTGDRFKALLEEWKGLPHGDRSVEQALWKRFSAARSAFDKARRAHFATMDSERAAAKEAKEDLIAKATVLASSTDWNAGAQGFRDLMAQWKNAPRGPRKDEDGWWARFKAAQDQFFAARQAASEVRDAELRINLGAKEELLAQAQALLPITDIGSATTRLRAIQAKWEAAGAVPRADRDRIEGGLRKVEEALRAAEGERWRRTDPAKRAFAESTVEKFRESIAKLEARRDRAAAAGDAAGVAEAESSIASTASLLQAAERSLAEYS